MTNWVQGSVKGGFVSKWVSDGQLSADSPKHLSTPPQAQSAMPWPLGRIREANLQSDVLLGKVVNMSSFPKDMSIRILSV